MSGWIAGHLTGGLGNRLFQHAAAAGLSEKWKVPLVFYLPDCTETGHGAFDNIFKLFPSIPQINSTVPIQRIPEPHNGVFTYTPFPEVCPYPYLTVDGWRQSELYFPSQGIVPDFEAAISKERCESLLAEYSLQTVEKRERTWFIHIRLGDYKILPHHQINIGDYYSKAIKYIPKNATILLFSDEIKEYGETLVAFFHTLGYTVKPVTLSDELESLYLMSQCWGGAIVANSTFSWWGAYLSRKLQPTPSSYVAVYPSVWGKGLPEAKDVVPLWGIRVPNE
jgi:hypothetical protein